MDVILIADDYSKASQRAVRWAAENLPLQNKRVVLLNVAVPPSAPVAPGGFVAAEVITMNPIDDPDATNEIKREARAALAETRDSAGLPDHTELLVVWGDPATEIVIVGNDQKADLIVIGSRGRGFLGRVILGSVSSHIVHHAGRPVLVVPPERPDKPSDSDTQTTSTTTNQNNLLSI